MSLANEKAESSACDAENDMEQRSSLPDISLTSREKSELENSMKGSLSSESILALIPPPKPSKDRKHSLGPPLPPKTKAFAMEETTIRDGSEPKIVCNRMKDLSNTDEIDALERFDGLTTTEEFYCSTRRVEYQSQEFSSKSLSVGKSFASFTLSDPLPSHVFDEQPPPLPIKTRSRTPRSDHHKSIYDNMDDNRNSLETKMSSTSSNSSLTSSLSARDGNHEFTSFPFTMKTKYMSCIESGSDFGLDILSCKENPPPLPLKKKHSK